MDIDYAAGRITSTSADEIIEYITERGLTLDWIIETHVHADHLSAAPYIQERLGGQIMISEKIVQVQDMFGKVFNEGTEFQRDGSQFDRLLSDGETYMIGGMAAYAMATPGHTPACMVHVIGDAAFVGDTLFMPDGGSARADFPSVLYDSIQKVLTLPGETRLFMCHDYGPGGREIAWETTVAEERAANIHVGGGKTREEPSLSANLKTELIAMLPRLRRFALNLKRSQREADDLVQDACVQAMKNNAKWDPSLPLDRWVFRITRNLWISETRKRKACDVFTKHC